MKILVLSDSHGAFNLVDKAINQNKTDAVIFCGDGIRDLRDAEMIYPDRQFYCVKGNCDYGAYNEHATLMPVLCGHKLMITHGCEVPRHKISEMLPAIALANGCDVLLYGHTHHSVFEKRDGIAVINPGSLKKGDYAVINIAPDCDIECELCNLLF